MITVAGFNTAIDRRIELDSALRPGVVQRAVSGRVVPGGKGLHVAQMVAELGEPVRLVGLTDIAHDALIAGHLRGRNVQWYGVQGHGELRQCFAISEPRGRVTEILEPSEELAPGVQAALLETVRRLLDDSSALVLTGSLPHGFPADTYAELIRQASERGVRCLVDTSGEALSLALEARPWLVKPNSDEAASLIGQSVDDVSAAVDCARQLNQRGVARAVVTLGAQGAVGYDGSDFLHAWSDSQEARNSVGSGDCFMAALAVGTVQGQSLEVSLHRAVASGAANAASDETGYANAADVTAWIPRVRVERLRGGTDPGASNRTSLPPGTTGTAQSTQTPRPAHTTKHP